MPIHSLRSAPPDSLHIGLINNMPDGAIKATERQFRTLLEEASGETPVVLTLFSLPTVPRSATALELISQSHAGLEDLWGSPLDGLIVTGAEPTAASLNDEPYWQTLQQVFDWADANTYSTILSCLASHAAVLHRDGIARQPRKTKRFGLIPCEKTSHHPLTASIPSSFAMPHSRWNELSRAELERSGYRILAETVDGSPDLFIKKHNSLFVYFQGHPEYETNSLMLEYRRDLGRFLKGERRTVPQAPENYFTSHAAEALADLPENLPFDFLESCIQNLWRSTARTLYRNWLDLLLNARKTARARAFRPAGVFAPEAPAEQIQTLCR
jgi:homoserine O-succinyltransferase